MKFKDLQIKKEIHQAIQDLGFEETTEIQASAIPDAVNGVDILAQSQTGTGKTLAFLIPIIEQLEDNDNMQSLILAPTRELAVQINNEFNKLAKHLNLKSVSVYGGDPITTQMKLLKQKPQMIIGTPGRVIDLIERKKIKLDEIRFFSLDEVDEMLNMGFIDDIIKIEKKMPRDKQVLFFSATMSKKIMSVADTFLRSPKVIKVASKSLTVDKVKQFYAVAKSSRKNEMLKNIIDFKHEQKIIIFTTTKRRADEIFDFLFALNYSIEKIHGDLHQTNRLKTISNFKNGRTDIIVATDVVARGIDIDNVDLVINYELPQDIEYYIHRIGRTGRGSAEKGEAITLVSPREYDKTFKYYEKKLNCKIAKLSALSDEKIIERLQTALYTKLETNMKNETVEDVYFQTVDMFSPEDLRLLLATTLSTHYPELSLKKRKEFVKQQEQANKGKEKNSSNSNSRSGSNSRNRSNGNGSYNRNRNRNNSGGNRSKSGGGNRSNRSSNYSK